MELISGAISYLLIDLIAVSIGRVAVAVLTLGRWRGEAMGGREARIHSRAGALSFVVDGQRVLTRAALELLGVGALLILALGVVVLA